MTAVQTNKLLDLGRNSPGLKKDCRLHQPKPSRRSSISLSSITGLHLCCQSSPSLTFLHHRSNIYHFLSHPTPTTGLSLVSLHYLQILELFRGQGLRSCDLSSPHTLTYICTDSVQLGIMGKSWSMSSALDDIFVFSGTCMTLD